MSNLKSVLLVFLMVCLVLSVVPFQINEVKANPTYENFLDYTEVDLNEHISKNSSRVTGAGIVMEESAYVYKDKGVGYFSGDFDHKLDVKFTSTTFGGYIFLWGLANEVGDWVNYKGTPSNYVSIHITHSWEASPNYILQLYGSFNGGANQISGVKGNVNINTMYYLRIKRTGNTVTCDIYASAANRDSETSPTAQLTITLGGATAFRYIYAIHSFTHATSTGKDMSGYVENLDLQEVAGEEYFETLTETLTITDNLTHYTSYTRLLTETITVTDILQTYGIFTRTNTESIIITDIIHRQASFQRLITETINILDQISLHIGIVLEELLIVETIHITDSITLTKEAVPFTIGLPIVMALITIACIITFTVTKILTEE